MALKKVLVVYKKSYLELQKDFDREKVLRLLPGRIRHRIRRSDAENRRTKEAVVRALEREGIRYHVSWRGQLTREARYDLIVTVGGDGTFLAASHAGLDSPILAVNSDPENSLALFAGADRRNFAERLRQWLDGRVHYLSLGRLDVIVNGRTLPVHPLNDVLFAHQNPAAMSRYLLSFGSRREEQKSSGIWFCTAAGSTAAARAAGGRVMPIASRRLQFVVREPYTWRTKYRLTQGITSGSIRIDVMTRRASLYLDGHRISQPVTVGDRVSIRPSRHTLTVYGYDPERRKKLFHA